MLIANNAPGRTVFCNGQEFKFFSGTSYLGMNTNKQFTGLLQEGLNIYGSNYGSSRNSNFRLGVYEEAEQKLAAFAGAAAAITVSSGYQAAQLVVRSIQSKDKCFYGPNTHPALWSSPQDAYTGSFSKWYSELDQIISLATTENVTILCNSLDPLFSLSYDFEWVQNLPEGKSITLIIDDSHGIGVTGAGGAGIFNQIKCKENIELIVIASLAKAMGIPGGVILATSETITKLKSSPYFGAASPIPPAYLHAYLQAGEVYDQARKKLAENILAFEILTKGVPIFQHMANYPVFYTEAAGMAAFLEEKYILISSFPYPAAHDPVITRVIINASHQEQDLVQLYQHIADFNLI